MSAIDAETTKLIDKIWNILLFRSFLKLLITSLKFNFFILKLK